MSVRSVLSPLSAAQERGGPSVPRLPLGSVARICYLSGGGQRCLESWVAAKHFVNDPRGVKECNHVDV